MDSELISGCVCGVLFPMIGLFLLGTVPYGIAKRCRMLKAMKLSEGTVVCFREITKKTFINKTRVQMPRAFGRMYAPVVEFTVDGKIYKVFDENYLFFRRYKIGQKVRVYYSAANPKKDPQIKSCFIWLWILPTIIIGGCALYTIFPAFDWLMKKI